MSKERPQAIIDELIRIKKLHEKTPPDELPPQGLSRQYSLISSDGKIRFFLTINRKNNSVSGKCSYQTRLDDNMPLVRLDINATGEHTNPNGEKISGHHIHFLREGFRDTIAEPLSNYYPIDNRKELTIDELILVFEQFCLICNIEETKITQVPLN